MKLLLHRVSPWIKHAIVLLVCFSMQTLAQAQIWSEEFNYTSAPDSDVWSCDIGDWGWGNAELQNYTSSTNNVWVDGSNLVIKAIRQGNNFTSARIKTLDKLTFKYGTVEARIQIPDLANGLWPAFWTLGNKFPASGWPACGEIDVMEMGNGSAISAGLVNRRVASTAHWESGGNYASYGSNNNRPSEINDTFVVYRMEWTPTHIRTYIDNDPIWVFDISGAAASDLEEFHEPHFFILNLAVGGNYTGILDAGGITADFPAEYKVDWIRLYDNGHTVLGGTSTLTPPSPGMNLLANAGFESGTSGWNLNLSGGTASALTAYAHSGIAALVINSTGAGGWASPNASQSFSANPGDVFNMQGYLLNPVGSPITGASFGLFKIEFRDSSGALLAPASVDIGSSANAPYFGAESTPLLNAASATDTWIFSEAQAEAPPGTVEAGFYVLNVNQPGNPGPMYFDDIQVMLLGGPVLPFALNHAVMGENLQVSFPTQSGISYTLAYKSSLTNATWIPVETIIGDGTTNSALYPMNDPVRFYRVLIP
ncbi:glycoside hydrolase family 16 protein [Pontiella sp.]|uniref:glycoside hydrolase family 16 protein n=1 Tax=Pontiella sp. TaxID=2837462 RepID=UPI003561C7CC